MRAELAATIPGWALDVRSFEPSDVASLGGLLYRSYRGTVDDEGETPEQAAIEISRTVGGAYGEFMPRCSKVVERGGTLLSAALITRWEGRPLVAFSFTDPAFAGQGLARACLLAAMSELADQGERELRLVVTLANTRAVRLYTRLGFQFEP